MISTTEQGRVLKTLQLDNRVVILKDPSFKSSLRITIDKLRSMTGKRIVKISEDELWMSWGSNRRKTRQELLISEHLDTPYLTISLQGVSLINMVDVTKKNKLIKSLLKKLAKKITKPAIQKLTKLTLATSFEIPRMLIQLYHKENKDEA